MAAEKNFENRVKKYLESQGIYAFGTAPEKMPVKSIGYWEKRFANKMTKKGLPDMHFTVNKICVDAEIKADNGRPSELQIFMCNQIRSAGGFAFVLYPSAFDQFKEFVEALKNEVSYTKEIPLIWK